MLPKRLLCCAEYVRKGVRVCDIGTDHALLPCYLARMQISPQILACDVNEKPLLGAAKTIARNGCEASVSVRLSDGLAAVEPSEADDIVIAGMGGELIARIVLECSWLRSADKHLILQPMTQIPFLRKSLCENGFAILSETAVEDSGHHYTVIHAAFSGTVHHLTLLETYAGDHLNHPSGESAVFLQMQQMRVQRMADGLRTAGSEEAAVLQQLAEDLGKCLEDVT